MPNKTVTITEPTASDIQSIAIIYSGGVAQSVQVSGTIRTTDGETSYRGNCSNLVKDYTAAEQTAMKDLATAAAAKLAADKGF